MTQSLVVRSERRGPDVAVYPAGATFGPRVLRDHEFVWLLSGAARWSCADEDVELVPGMLLLVRPGERDMYRWTDHGSSRHAFVHFDATGGPPSPWPRTRLLTDADPMAALCQHLLRLGAWPDRRVADQVDQVLTLLLQLFVAEPVNGQAAAELSPQVRMVAAYLRREWRSGRAHPVPVGELAAAAGVSAGHLSRIFARELGTGPAAAVELLRLARVATLLRRSNLTLASLAVSTGFADAFHLSRRFRAAYGMPPSRYRSQADPDPLLPLRYAGLTALAHAVNDEPVP